MLFEGVTDQEAGLKFEQEILACLRKVRSLYVYPYADTHSASREQSVRFINPQPSDFGGVLAGGKAIMIEAKATRKYDCLYDCCRSTVRANQAASARRVTKQGGVYIFLFLDRQEHRIKAYEGGHISEFYHRRTGENKKPIMVGEWSGRLEFCSNLIKELER